jgi:small subunit ribosomal protein S6
VFINDKPIVDKAKTVSRSRIAHKEFRFMTTYETIYILRPDLGEELVDQAIIKYQTLLKDQGSENIEVQHRGRRRLAYEIRKFREGIYVQMNYDAAGPAIAVMERAMRISDDVIRYLTIKPEEIAPSEEEAVAAV